MTTTDEEFLNHQAYMDIICFNPLSYPDDDYYMECYKFWKNLDPYEDIYQY